MIERSIECNGVRITVSVDASGYELDPAEYGLVAPVEHAQRWANIYAAGRRVLAEAARDAKDAAAITFDTERPDAEARVRAGCGRIDDYALLGLTLPRELTNKFGPNWTPRQPEDQPA